MTDPQTQAEAIVSDWREECFGGSLDACDPLLIHAVATALAEAETRGFERGLAESERQLTKACKQAINNAMKYYTSPTLEASRE